MLDWDLTRICSIEPVLNEWQKISRDDPYELWVYDIGDYCLWTRRSSGGDGYEWSLSKPNNPNQGVIIRSRHFSPRPFSDIEKTKANAKAYLDFWLTIP